MKKLLSWFHDLALFKKIMYIVIVAGIIPISIIFMVSTIRLKSSSVEMQMYMLNKGYEQTYQSVEGFLTRMYNMSTLAVVNSTTQDALKTKDSQISAADELVAFDYISSFAYSLELNMDEASVLYFIDDSFLIAQRYNSRFRSIADMEGQNWTKNLQLRNGNPTWVTMKERNQYEQLVNYFGTVRTLWDDDDYTKSLGTVAVMTDINTMKEMMIPSLADQVFYLETVEGEVIGSSEDNEKFKDLIYIKQTNLSKKFREIVVGDITYFVRSTALDDGNLFFVSVVPKTSLYTDVTSINLEMLVWYILVCILLFILSIAMSRPITNRIKQLDKKMTEEGKLLQLDVVPHKDEIGRLIIRYNDMVQKVETLLDEQFYMGQEKISAELKALQSQINPHFLYNTLDMLNWMARKNETQNIQDALQAMSGFYRMALSKGSDFIRIEDEIHMCKAYIEIQTMRYKGKIQFEIDIQPEILDYLIPKITLQPLIENAIIHGINEKLDGRGRIILSGWAEEDRITLSVTDDGNGIDDIQRAYSKTGGSHYGMNNIEKRLSLFYRDEIRLEIDSSIGIGTCVSFNIPMRK